MNLRRQIAESKVTGTKRYTRKKYSAEEKMRIVLKGVPDEIIISELCRQEGINTNLYYKWRRDFLEANKERLARNIKIRISTSDLQHVINENRYLMQLVAELSLENRMLKKRLDSIGINAST